MLLSPVERENNEQTQVDDAYRELRFKPRFRAYKFWAATLSALLLIYLIGLKGQFRGEFEIPVILIEIGMALSLWIEIVLVTGLAPFTSFSVFLNNSNFMNDLTIALLTTVLFLITHLTSWDEETTAGSSLRIVWLFIYWLRATVIWWKVRQETAQSSRTLVELQISRL